MKDESTIALIASAQQGDEFAMNEFLRIVRDHHMPPRIRRYINRNVLVEQGEIESEFLRGCWKALPQAKLDLGNPLLFILWKGQLAVAQLFRKQIKQGVKVDCRQCGRVAMGYKNGKVECSQCGARDVETHMIMVNESTMIAEQQENGERGPIWDRLTADDMHGEMDLIWSTVTYDIQVEEIRARIRGRTLQLFDAIIIQGINRDSSNNYLAEIAKMWGISTTAVAIYLRKLRVAIEAYYLGDEIVEEEEPIAA